MKRTHLFFLFALVILSLTLFVIPASRARRSSETRAQRRQIKEFAQRALANAGIKPLAFEDQGIAPALAPGQPLVMDGRSAMSAALLTTLYSPDQLKSSDVLLASWDGREDFAADRGGRVAEFPTGGSGQVQTRAAISEHTVANGFNQNVFYLGDAVGNLAIGVDTLPGSGPSGTQIDSGPFVNIPDLVNTGSSGGVTLQNPTAGDCADTQVTITGIAVNPVADLGDFGAASCGQIGEVVYVSTLEAGCASNAANQPIRTRIFALGFVDGVGMSSVGARQILRSKFSNTGIAVDDEGSLYYHLIDRAQNTGGAIFKATEQSRTVTNCGAANPRRNRLIATIPDPPSLNSWQGTVANPVVTQGGVRNTNFSGNSTTFGNIVAIAAGPNNIVYAALARSFVATDDSATQITEGPFSNPAALGATPSMIISFADVSGKDAPGSDLRDGCSGTSPATGVIPVADGIADGAQAALTRTPGVNNFRVFALGTGPDIRGTAAGTDIGATAANTLQLEMQVDPTIYAGITVDEEGSVFVISGGTPTGLGTNPSPNLGEILAFPDKRPGDRRGDFVDFRGNALPNPPNSGGNVGDGDSDRFDHIFSIAPNDPTTNTPIGMAGLSRGHLLYLNRTRAVNPNSFALLPNGAPQGDDTSVGPIAFDDFDASGQVSGGDDQNTPFRGDDSDGFSNPPGANNPTSAGALRGGFEFNFGASGGQRVWNSFFLNSNGNITFNGSSASPTVNTTLLRADLPRIAPAWANLNPGARSVDLNNFPTQSLGFANINSFKIRWTNTPAFGKEVCSPTGVGGTGGNTFSVTLYDDANGIDENASQPLNPANPIGNNSVPFDLQEGPTDLLFSREPNTSVIVGESQRFASTGYFTFDYGRMDLLGSATLPVITGYSSGGLAPANPPGMCENDLSTAAPLTEVPTYGVIQGQTSSTTFGILGEGTEPTLFEAFDTGAEPTGALPGTVNFDLRSQGNDAAASTPTGASLSRDRIALYGLGGPPPPVVSIGQPLSSPPVTTPTTSGFVNAFGAVQIDGVGSELFPNETTTVCQSDPAQRAGKTVSTAITMAIDQDGNGIPELTIPLTNVQTVNEHLVRGTLPTIPGLPGTAFPLSVAGSTVPGSTSILAQLTITTTFTAGDNNLLGPFTRTAPVLVSGIGKFRAPVVLTVTPTTGANGQSLAINGGAFKLMDGTANVTEVKAVERNNPANVVTATSFSLVDASNLNATFNFGAANGGKQFLIFATGPGGTSRNVLTLPAGAPAGTPLGNEAGNIVTYDVGFATDTMQLSAATSSITEDCTIAPITITRSNPGAGTVTVDLNTSDGTALQKSDYTATFATVTFGPGETSKVVNIPITEDSLVEGSETVNLALANATGGAVFGSQTTAVLTINDDDASPGPNAIDDAATFVGQQYHDFLNRQADAAGQSFWTSQITSCGANAACVEVARINVSAAFFLSIEFQESGFYVLRTQRVAFGKRASAAATRYPYFSFLKDAQQVGNGVIIGSAGADALLESNKQAYATNIVTSAAFIAAFPVAQTASQYVDALFASAGVVPTTAERNAAITAFGGGGTSGRVAALRSVVDASSVRTAETNPAFVLMEYYGYLRRNPTDAPDNNDNGFQFWLGKLNAFNGNFVAAEMVKAFLSSPEYRQRFGTN